MIVRERRIRPDTGTALLAPGAAILVIAATAAVALSGVVVTAGGVDQTLFHLPTIEKFRAEFPWPDVVDVQTATTPLYHLVVMAVSAPLGSGLVATQVVGSLFAAALAASIAYSVRTVADPILALALVLPVVASAYFWESALWIGTDCAALLFTTAALFALVRPEPRFVVVGALCALAILTRQSCAWALLPAAIVALSGSDAASRGRNLASAVLPGAVSLGVVFWMWGGATPPKFAELNGIAVSGAATSYGFAVAGAFAVPLVVAVMPRLRGRDVWRAVAVGIVAALPAVIFASSVTEDDTRRGGWLWAIVGPTPSFADRSSGVTIAAFVGGAAACLLVSRLDRRTAVVVVSALVGLVLVLTFGSRLYQKYVELPVVVMYVMCARSLVCAGAVRHRWPLLCVALVQVVLAVGIVGVPLARGLL